jgi:N utilization substance protein B
MSKGRRSSREEAYKLLFEASIRGPEALEDLKNTLSRQLDDEESREFSYTLIQGTKEHESELMEAIKLHLENWDIKRLTITDKILLMMAFFEIKYLEDVPPIVSIDEAIELAKVYGTEESPRFLNGVLDSFHHSQKQE